jgi:hypothetical protein
VEIDALFQLVARVMTGIIEELDPAARRPLHWIVIENSLGVETAAVEEDVEPSEALPSFLKHGVNGAAYVTLVSEPMERLLAYGVTTDPHNSDWRQCAVIRTGTSVALARWDYMV